MFRRCWISRRWIFLLSFASLLCASPALEASDPTGVYALIERVVVEPSVESPERLQVWGVFAVAVGKHGEFYRAPQRGYMYFKLDDGDANKCRREWADLARKADTGEPVALGSRYFMAKRNRALSVRGARVQPANPDVYPLGMGLRQVRNVEYSPVKQLKLVPEPVSPLKEIKSGEPDRRWPAQRFQLTVNNVVGGDENTRYLFEIETASGDIYASPPVKAGEGQTSWAARIVLEKGKTFTWRARVLVDKVEFTPVVATQVQVK